MKTAIVLGASSGVGASILCKLADAGYRVIGFHLGRHQAEADTLTQQYQLVEMHQQDAGSTRERVEDATQILERYYDLKVDVLVHSLSGAWIGPTWTTPPHGIETTFNRLAHSFLWWTQELLQRNLMTSSTSLIALTSPCPEFYLRNTGVIGAAKAALEAYVRALAVELGDAGIRVNAVKFATIMTPALRKVIGDEGCERMTQLHSQIVPGGRMQRADDVARFVVQLANDPWCNGAILDYTGGATSTLLDHAFYAGKPR